VWVCVCVCVCVQRERERESGGVGGRRVWGGGGREREKRSSTNFVVEDISYYFIPGCPQPMVSPYGPALDVLSPLPALPQLG
ncbi:MAG: hypothetical protein MJE68_27785, partial [Proteobacteria bacterium]|nr:hypothetical protein [Pseudomonadota bacterium]